jgi:hypothetical protein
MRKVLLRLALLPNGSVARMDADRGGGSAQYYSDVIPTLGEPRGALDLLEERAAAHIYYGTQWAAAIDDDERAQVLEQAEDFLDRAIKSRADRSKVETRADLDERILAEGEGWPDKDVAIAFRCSIRMVHEARRAAGRDDEFGRPTAALNGLSAGQRRERVRELAGRNLNAKQISRALGIPYITVRRDLGRNG